MDAGLVEAIYTDWKHAPIDDRLRSPLGMLESLMLHPESFRAEQFEAMRAAGHDRVAMEDAVAVGAMFACITRLADCLGFEHPNTQTKKMTTRYLLGAGYGPSPGQLHGPRRFAQLWAELARAVVTTPGNAKPPMRRQVYEWVERDARSGDANLRDLPQELQGLVAKGSRSAHEVTDDDITAMLRKGWDEGGVWEIIVALASSAGATRYAIAMDAIDALEGASALG
jgi:hypothetical protein